MVEDMVCASMPTPFLAVGESFWDFTQVGDEQVRGPVVERERVRDLLEHALAHDRDPVAVIPPGEVRFDQDRGAVELEARQRLDREPPPRRRSAPMTSSPA